MSTDGGQSGHTLQLRRFVNATPQRVFDAWTDPKELAQWFAPHESFTTTVQSVELRVGGRYRIEMIAPSGTPHTAVGVYREIVPGKRIAFTWKWFENAEMEDTLVTLEFLSHGDQTELVLTHSLFVSADARDHHTKGWSGMLPRLETRLQQGHAL